MNLKFTTYIAGTTPVHRCDARVKIVALLVYSIAIFTVRAWWAMIAFAVAVAVLVAVARIPVRKMATPLAPVVMLAAFAVVFAVAASPGIDGVAQGMFVAVRMVALVAASMVVCFTTTSSDLLDAFAHLIGPFRRLHVPVDDIALTLSLALRFIPVIADEFAQVRTAQIARGALAEGVTFARKLSIWGAAFQAVFVGLFRRADALAIAMDARCYGLKDRKAGNRKACDRKAGSRKAGSRKAGNRKA